MENSATTVVDYGQTGSEFSDVGLHDTITAISSNDVVYPIDKLKAHINDVPHLAISVFLFHGKSLMLQRRAQSKYHSGGLWANTVCSHPRWNETAAACAPRRLQEELGVSCELREFGIINYRARVGHLFENESVHCFVGHLDASVPQPIWEDNINPLEVCEVQWMTLTEIQQDIKKYPDVYTEWFKIYMSTHHGMIDAISRH